MQIIMSPREVELLSSFLSKSDSYYEFGIGGSTALAAKLVRHRIYAVDSSKDWIEKVRPEITSPGKDIYLRHIDIGPLQDWGTPRDSSHEHLFPAYSRSIANSKEFDFCLVDGRFRVACFLEALQAARSDSVIAIHDYRVRPQYHVVEAFARPIAECEELCLFVVRPRAKMRLVRKMAEAYRKNPA